MYFSLYARDDGSVSDKYMLCRP